MRPHHIVLSLVIVLLIGLQASTFVTGTKIWPFMAYCMYSHCYEPHDIEAGQSTVFAVTAAGNEFEVDERRVGLAFHAWKERFYQPMTRDEPDAPRRLADKLGGDEADPIVAFRVKRRVLTITDDGIVEENVIKTYPVED
jgi:hypothetical protein